ncbi:MAG: electron transfer flavoprotein subunit alpha/FixB family protein [archaeon]|nr:electron transfer flavoprotein subunit alpha/FixB family protein [archaeon]
MGCESCTDGSCQSEEKGGLPPGMLQRYRLGVDRSDGFLVWIETERDAEGNIRVCDHVKELLGKIRQMDGGRSRVWGVIFGHLELKPLYPELYAHGVDTLYEVHDRVLSTFHPEAYADNLAQIIVRTEPAVVLFGATPRGRELAPRVAARLDAGLTADCTELALSDRDLLMTRPAFGGNVMATIRCTSFPQMATVRPGVFPVPEPFREGKGTVIYWQSTCRILKDIISSEIKRDSGEDITKARILISLGAGVKRESISVAESLARKLGGTVSCSRKLVEKGWFNQSRQVGQSGKTVAPDLYLAFGISGAVQHLAGIGLAGRVIAINRDANAGISEVADEIVVGDANAILRELERSL